MAQPSPQRKGSRSVLRLAGLLLAAGIVALPVSFIGGMAMTPLLWRLEPVLGMELAGHSGPSDWILATLFGIVTVGMFGMLLWLTREKEPSASNTDPRQSAPGAT